MINKSLKKKSGELKILDILKFGTLENLCEDNEYFKINRSSMYLANDESSDNILKLLRHQTLYSFIEDVLERKIYGAFAECGCWKGRSLFATNKLLKKHNSDKTIFVFDSFEAGLSEFKAHDKNLLNSKQRKSISEVFSSSFKILQESLQNEKNIVLRKGWIPEIFKEEENREYAFVHIDVDMYEPTLTAHKYFFERLNPGGIIVCDDYGYRDFPGAKKAVDEFLSNLDKNSYSHFFKTSTGQSVLIK